MTEPTPAELVAERPGRLQGPSEDTVKQALSQTFDRVVGLHTQLRDYRDVPAPGSSLRRDDEVAAPYGLSHAVVRQLQAAADHLDAIRVLIVEAETPFLGAGGRRALLSFG